MLTESYRTYMILIFALSGLTAAVMETIGMMIDMQQPPGYPHLF
jgi:hypothetical protein